MPNNSEIKVPKEKTSVKRPSKPRASPNGKQLPLDLGLLKPEQKSFIRGAYKAKKKTTEQWRGIAAVPPGSILDEILSEFQKNSSIPLEVPFFTLMHYLAGYLISKKVNICFRGKDYGADFWTVVLTTSGAGKTFVEGTITNGLGATVPRMENGAASAGRFLEHLEVQPQALWIEDEFGQFLKEIDRPGSPMAQIKEYLLKIYDNRDLTRSTLKSSIAVKNPMLSILGFNALDSFTNNMSLESMVDGFSQRFGYVITKPDPHRRWQEYPHWEIKDDKWEKMWKEMLKGILPKYYTSEKGAKTFDAKFKELAYENDVDESFYRRVLWRAHKFAMIYHILRGQAADPEIGSEDYGWAMRVIEMQLSDAAELIERVGGSDLKKQLDQASKAVERLKADNQVVSARNIIRSCSLIKTASTAKYILDILDVRIN